MLKLSRPGGGASFKCGEIFCVTAEIFNVSCTLCESEMHLEQFFSHFQIHHLTLAEESVHLEELEKENKVELTNDSSLVEHLIIKEEDVPEPDPIQQPEELVWCPKTTDFLEEDDDDKCLQELFKLSKAKQTQIKEKLKEETDEKTVAPRKRSTRNAAKKPRKRVKKENIKIASATDDDENSSKATIVRNEIDEDGEYIDDDLEKQGSSTKEKDSENDCDPVKDLPDELPFPCIICKRSYRSKHSLQKHNHSVHNPNKPPRKRKDPKPLHKCDVCNEVFRSDPVLRAHKWKHTGIFCDICGRSFTQSGHLIRHKIRHTGIKDFKCKECTKEFFTAKELKSHMLCHTKTMPVICEICGKGCRNMAVLSEHMRRHTGERPAKCNVCGKCFFTCHDLNVHAVTHTTERPFACDICGSTFQRKKALRVHKRIHSDDRKHVCKICGKAFAQSSGLKSHMRSHDAAVEVTTFSNTENLLELEVPGVVLMHTSSAPADTTQTTETDVITSGSRDAENQPDPVKAFQDDKLPFPCTICKRSYRTKESLRKHNYGVHNPNKRPKKPQPPKCQHKCDVCNEIFRSAPILRAHKWKHTGIVCDICGRSFTQSCHLTRHKIRHTGIKDFKCKECNNEFYTAKELKAHMIRHTGVMPVICEICGKRCREQGLLTAHMRRHTGERPAKCDVCGKSFYSFHDLNVHAVTHTSERPFKCEICGSTFQRKKALRVHKRIHSKDRSKHVCKICGKAFAQSGGLKSHMRSHDAAVEVTTFSNTENLLEVHNTPGAVLMYSSSAAEDTIQTTETDVITSGSRDPEDQVIGLYTYLVKDCNA